MKYNFVFNEENRPITVTAEKFKQENGILLDVSETFNLRDAEDWLYQNNELVYSPLKTMEEKLAEAEAFSKAQERFERNEAAKIEIQTALLKAQINTLDVDDNTALRWIDFYPDWEVGKDYAAHYKVQHDGKLYRVRTAHTSQESWQPGNNTESLYQRIDETHTGTLEDPIPYDGNMALEVDKHYSQNDVIYLCTADTVNPVYHALSDLVGLYVSVVK